ncbi:hypothetical protein DASC09_058360 [Saccharomycopsis crataegensis]|uniref:Securin n=1 Tax=Saccharomycopsis crataegensis TaxID=43959 RepID=A0AAV5QVN5_9ASCO|nr:hypothetical protein DASC09_058360 [Saccharomycopsis crataegensis]
MSSFQYINKENATASSRPLKGKFPNINKSTNPQVTKQSLKPQDITQNNNALTERVPLGGKGVINSGTAPSNKNNGKGFKRSLKRTNSLLLDDNDLKRKIQVQKDTSLIEESIPNNEEVTKPQAQLPIKEESRDLGPLRRRKLKSKSEDVLGSPNKRQKLDTESASELSDNGYSDLELEYVPDCPSPLPYVPDNVLPLSEEDIKFFHTKNRIPEKHATFKEIDFGLAKLLPFDGIPEVELELDMSDFDEEDKDYDELYNVDSMVKKQPTLLENCDVKLISQKIPDLHYDS